MQLMHYEGSLYKGAEVEELPGASLTLLCSTQQGFGLGCILTLHCSAKPQSTFNMTQHAGQPFIDMGRYSPNLMHIMYKTTRTCRYVQTSLHRQHMLHALLQHPLHSCGAGQDLSLDSCIAVSFGLFRVKHVPYCSHQYQSTLTAQAVVLQCRVKHHCPSHHTRQPIPQCVFLVLHSVYEGPMEDWGAGACQGGVAVGGAVLS